MANEWREMTIGEFSPFLYGSGLRESERNSGATPVFGSNGIVGYHNVPYTDGPTMIIGRKGSVGKVHFSPVPCWPTDTTFYIIEKDRTLARFKYYLLSSIVLEYMNSDSAVPGLSRENAHSRSVKISPLPEQRAIAHILGTLDGKIELNRWMSERWKQWRGRCSNHSLWILTPCGRSRNAAKKPPLSLLPFSTSFPPASSAPTSKMATSCSRGQARWNAGCGTAGREP